MRIRSFIRKNKTEPKGHQVLQFRLTPQEYKHIQIGANIQTGRVMIEHTGPALVIKLSTASNLGIPVKHGFDTENNRYEQISYRPLTALNVPLTPWQSVTPTLTKWSGDNVIAVHLTQLKQIFPRFYARKQEPLYKPDDNPPGPVKVKKPIRPYTTTPKPLLTEQIQQLLTVLNNLTHLAGLSLETDSKTGEIKVKKEDPK